MDQSRTPLYTYEEYDESAAQHGQKRGHPNVNPSSPTSSTPNPDTYMRDRQYRIDRVNTKGQSRRARYLSDSQMKVQQQIQQGREQYKAQLGTVGNQCSYPYPRHSAIYNNPSTPNIQQPLINTSEGVINPQLLVLNQSSPQEQHGFLAGSTRCRQRGLNPYTISSSSQLRQTSVGKKQNPNLRGIQAKPEVQGPQTDRPRARIRTQHPQYPPTAKHTPPHYEFTDAGILAGLHGESYPRSGQQYPVVAPIPRPSQSNGPEYGTHPTYTHMIADPQGRMGGGQPHRKQAHTPPHYAPASQLHYESDCPLDQGVTSMTADVQNGAWPLHGNGALLGEQDQQQTQCPNVSRHKQRISTSSFQHSHDTETTGGNMAKRTTKQQTTGAEATRAGSQLPPLCDEDFPPSNRPYPKDKFITLIDDRPFQQPQESNANMGDNGNDDGLEARLLLALSQEKELDSIASRLPQLPQNPHPDFLSQYCHQPKPVKIAPTASRVLIVHDFVRNLPAGRPSPFNQEIFMDTELCTRLSVKYKTYCVYNSCQSVKSLNGGEDISGSCSVYTRKFPVGFEHVPRMALDEPARKKRTPDDSPDALLSSDPSIPIVWQYSAVVHMEGEVYRVDIPVPTKLASIDGMEFDLEPSWDDVVTALKAEIGRQEMIKNVPVSRTFKQTERIPHPLATIKREESQYAARPPPTGWSEPFAHDYPHFPQPRSNQPPHTPHARPKQLLHPSQAPPKEVPLYPQAQPMELPHPAQSQSNQPPNKTPSSRISLTPNGVFTGQHLDELSDIYMGDIFVRFPSPDPYGQFSKQMNQQNRQPGHPCQSPIQSIRQPSQLFRHLDQHPSQYQGQRHQHHGQNTSPQPEQSMHNDPCTMLRNAPIPESPNQQTEWPFSADFRQIPNKRSGPPHQYPPPPVYPPLSIQNDQSQKDKNQKLEIFQNCARPTLRDEVTNEFDRQSATISPPHQQETVNQNQRQRPSSTASLRNKVEQDSSIYPLLPELQHPIPQHSSPSLLTASSPTINASSIQPPKKRRRTSAAQGTDGKSRVRPRKAAKGDAVQQLPSHEPYRDLSQMPQMGGYDPAPYDGDSRYNWQNSQLYSPQLMQPGSGNIWKGEEQYQQYGYQRLLQGPRESGYTSPYSDRLQALHSMSRQSFMMSQPYQQHIGEGNDIYARQHSFSGTPSPAPKEIRPPRNSSRQYDPATQQDGAVDETSHPSTPSLESLLQQNLQDYYHNNSDDNFSRLDDSPPRSRSIVQPPRLSSRSPTTTAPAKFPDGNTSQIMAHFPPILNCSSSESASETTLSTVEILDGLPQAEAQEAQQRFEDIKNGVKSDPLWVLSGADSVGEQQGVRKSWQKIEIAQRQNRDREAVLKIIEEATRTLQTDGSGN